MDGFDLSMILLFVSCILFGLLVILGGISLYFYKNQGKKLESAKNENETLLKTIADTGQLEAHELHALIASLTQDRAKAEQEMAEMAILAEKKKAEYARQTEDFKRVMDNKREEMAVLAEKKKAEYARQTEDFKRVMDNKKEEMAVLTEKKKAEYARQMEDLKRVLDSKKEELIVLDEEILLQSFGFYKPRYELENSEAYKIKLLEIRAKQSSMVKSGKAAYATTTWSVNNSQKEGERMIKDYVKLILRSFNNECDACIVNVKFNNIESIEKRIRKAFDTLNSLGQRMHIVISTAYLDLKLQELYLVHEYQVKKQEEKEEQKRIREQMREEAKLLKEIEAMKARIEKEEKHFVRALEEINVKITHVTSSVEMDMLMAEKEKIESRLGEVEKNKQDVWNREQNTRAGYVYIISNLGSFGENVYKIGVTRRFDPSERVDELGDASVPFNFDIHATIFSDDAPALEAALHRAFDHRRLNLVNRRREFFAVTLDEIEKEVKTNFSKPFEFVRLADAPEYRQSKKLREQVV